GGGLAFRRQDAADGRAEDQGGPAEREPAEPLADEQEGPKRAERGLEQREERGLERRNALDTADEEHRGEALLDDAEVEDGRDVEEPGSRAADRERREHGDDEEVARDGRGEPLGGRDPAVLEDEERVGDARAGRAGVAREAARLEVVREEEAGADQ